MRWSPFTISVMLILLSLCHSMKVVPMIPTEKKKGAEKTPQARISSENIGSRRQGYKTRG